jgi:DNA-binding NarL/FixJ family response regulator
MPPLNRCIALSIRFKQENVIGNLSSVRILVVDDFPDWQRLVMEWLREHTHLQVIGVASDGLEAVLKAQQLQPDLILLDIGLPTLNGIEAARRIRKLSPKAKILFLSQESDRAVAGAAINAGGHGYVVKSEAFNDLFPALQAVLLGNIFVSPALSSYAAEFE